MTNKAFTLIELLVVVAIMGLMGAASVGAYRQMQRGMEERGVVENVSKFIALASERAQIDRKLVAVYFWNELLREKTANENAVVVGRAVAVRMKGRLSAKDGNFLIDEFGDLEQFDEDGKFKEVDNSNDRTTMRLYLMDGLAAGGSKELKYTVVCDTPQNSGEVNETYLSSSPKRDTEDSRNGKIVQFGYESDGKGTANNGDWKVGSIYGMEFQSIELPHNYIFESDLPKSMSQPAIPVNTLVFDAENGSKSGASVGGGTIKISCLRPGSGGAIAPQSIGSTEKPDAELN